VDALSQQRWIWNGIACGADTVLFWCWRDEVFGRESNGYGVIGGDGLADERLEAMKVTGRRLQEHAELIDGFRPADAEVGVLFSPLTYHHHWATEGHAGTARNALFGYARALVRASIPYRVVEEAHLDQLAGLKVLFLPRVTATGAELEKAIEAFVRDGGTVVCESECGAFSPEGLYRYPEDRFTTRLLGSGEVGRRPAPKGRVRATVDGEAIELDVSDQWSTPWKAGRGTTWAAADEGALLAEVPVGSGRVICAGAYLGEAYYRQRSGGLERLVDLIARRAGWTPPVEVLAPKPTPEGFLYVKTGTSGGTRVVFVFFQEGQADARLRFAPGFLRSGQLTDIITGDAHAVSGAAGDAQELAVSSPAWRFAVLVDR
jgi:beta-galactosidase